MAAAYLPRFDYGRLFVDCGHVVVRAAAPLILGILVFGVAPITATAFPWWVGSATTPSDTFRRVYIVVMTAKGVVNLLALSTLVAFVTVVSLKVLADMTWAEAFQPRRLIATVGTALAVTVMINWPTVAAPIAYALTNSLSVQRVAGWAEVICYAVVMTSIGIALPVATVDQATPLAAAIRAFRLLAKSRWRMVSFALLYFLTIGVCTYAVELGLRGMGVTYESPGWTLAAIRLPTVLVGAISNIALASIFLQARRIADGPSAAELHEVFA